MSIHQDMEDAKPLSREKRHKKYVLTAVDSSKAVATSKLGNIFMHEPVWHHPVMITSHDEDGRALMCLAKWACYNYFFSQKRVGVIQTQLLTKF